MAKSYNLDYKPGEDALQYYKRLAKTADQRLVRLEQLSAQKGYENVTAYAYARAQYDIGRYSAGHRFNTKPPLNADGTVNNQMLNEKISDIKTFLSSVSSTKAGITNVYEKRARAINKKFDTNYTWQDLADYFKSGDFEKHKKSKFASETIFKAIAKIQQAESKVLKDIDNNKKKNISDDVVIDVAIKMLSNSNTSLWKKYTNEERAALRKELNAQKSR